ncbi:response regulator [Prolixibacteraceae bacterium JC049]|nr:response regulator [Prolixibacteraceae bacterium JC049]
MMKVLQAPKLTSHFLKTYFKANTMAINAIIIDDEKNNRENLAHLLKQYCPMVSVLGEAASAAEGVELISILKPQLIFLDIEMPHQNGFDMLDTIQHNQFEVIFVTAYDHYALKAIKVNALDYILKPIDINELKNAVNKATLRIENQQWHWHKELIQNMTSNNGSTRIALTTQDQIEMVFVKDIIRCQGERNYTHVFLSDNTSRLISKPLSELEELLTEHQFMRVHKSHLINFNAISAFVKNDGGYIKMIDDSSVPVSRRKKELIIQCLK